MIVWIVTNCIKANFDHDVRVCLSIRLSIGHNENKVFI